MRLLLLGGTGAMGVHLAMLLSKQGNDVFVTTPRLSVTSSCKKLSE